VRVVGDHGVCADLLRVLQRRSVVGEQSVIELQHIARRVEVSNRIVSEARIECQSVYAVTDGPLVARSGPKLIVSVSDRDDVIDVPENRVIAVTETDRIVATKVDRVFPIPKVSSAIAA